MSRSAALLSLAVLGCRAPAASPPAAPEPATRVPAPEPEGAEEETVPDPRFTRLEAPFGGERWGFVMAATANRRFVFVRRFPGDPPASMGQHGGAALETTLTAFDLQKGTERDLGEIIDLDDARRFVVATDDTGATLLLDAESGIWETLTASADGDGNRCLAPRSATFSANGESLGLVSPDSRSFIVRDLATGDVFTVEAAAGTVVWRGWPHDDVERATLAVVPEGADPTWPRQKTSCACRFCNRYAMSYGMYGWGGPAFDLVEVTPTDPPSTVDTVPERQSAWLGDSAGCRLKASKVHNRLDRGPWQWDGCP